MMTVWKPEGSSQCRLNTRPTAARLAWFSVRCPLPSEEPLIFGHEPSSRVIFKGTSGQPLQPNNKYAGRHTRPRRGLGGAQLCPRLPRWTRPKQPQRAPAAGPGAHARMRICANSGALAPRDPAIRGHRYQAAPGDGASAAVARDGGTMGLTVHSGSSNRATMGAISPESITVCARTKVLLAGFGAADTALSVSFAPNQHLTQNKTRAISQE